MVIKEVKFNQEAKEPLIKGISTVCDAVATTMGYRGRTVLIESPGGFPNPTKDGVSVAKSIFLDDEDESDSKFNLNPKYGKNPGADAFRNLEKGDGDWQDQDTLDHFTGIGKNARIGSKDAFSLNEDDLDESTIQPMQQISNVLQSKGYSKEETIDSIIKLRQGDEFEKNKLEKEFPGLQQYILTLYGISKENNLNELEHVQWNNISEKDARNLKDYYDRTGRLPYGLTPNQYQDIVKKFNLDSQSINERKNPIKGGKGDKLSIDKVNPTELRMGIKVEMEHTNDKDKALDIVMDHLKEDPIYSTNNCLFIFYITL